MARPVTLFTGRRADLSLGGAAARAAGPGAADGLAMVRRSDFAPSSMAFDAFERA